MIIPFFVNTNHKNKIIWFIHSTLPFYYDYSINVFIQFLLNPFTNDHFSERTKSPNFEFPINIYNSGLNNYRTLMPEYRTH